MDYNIKKIFNISNLKYSIPTGSQVYTNKTDKSDIDYIGIFDGEFPRAYKEDKLIEFVNNIKKKLTSNTQIITYMYGKELTDGSRLMVEFISKSDLIKLVNSDFTKINKIKILKVFMGSAIIYDKTFTRNIFGTKIECKRIRNDFGFGVVGMNSNYYHKDMQLGIFLDKLIVGLIPYYKNNYSEINHFSTLIINNFLNGLKINLVLNKLLQNDTKKAFTQILYSNNKFNKSFIQKINLIFN